MAHQKTDMMRTRDCKGVVLPESRACRHRDPESRKRHLEQLVAQYREEQRFRGVQRLQAEHMFRLSHLLPFSDL